MKLRQSIRSALVLLAVAPVAALATTDGYFQHGYGVIAKGMGGAATAVTKDSFGGANNPATMVWVGNRFDAGISVFSPKRFAKRTGAGPFNASAKSGKDYFFIPGLGYNHLVNDRLSFGVTVYGNGGMDTDYNGSSVGGAQNILGGQGNAGVDLQQVIVAPTLSWKLNDSNSIGISPLIVYQRFKAFGLQAFGQMGLSSDANHLTNKGHDSSYGLGVRVGWFGQVNDQISLGASYSPQTRMSKFDKYKGLFAQHGRFDLPENYTLGVAVKPLEALTLALDYQRINYSKVKSVGNSSHRANLLGSSKGPGFGWHDVNVFKVGANFQATKKLQLRAGYNHTNNPIHKEDVTFNILAPGVVQDHATAGFTYQLPKGEISGFYAHAFSNSVSGQSLLGGKEKIRMRENGVGVSYGLTF